ncbi:MAG: hypothetical protein IT581_08760 [Verrucomicrobiales bacterium]|nr:hypothetical protein [Verrucomicrobiales bacterium]
MAAPANLQMIGMIPMPEAQYKDAMKANLDALRQAMTPQGINTAGLKPPPSRMMPVGQGADGKLYALVETCNPNYRPTAVPLSAMYPVDPKNPNSPPSEFIPMDALRNTPPPPADPGSAGLAVPEAAAPSGASAASLGGVAPSVPSGASAASLSGVAASAPSADLGQSLPEVGAPAAPIPASGGSAGDVIQQLGGAAAPKLEAAAAPEVDPQAATQVAQAGMSVAQGGSAGDAATTAAQGLAQPAASAALPEGTRLSPDQAQQLVQAMQQLQAARETQTQAMLGQVTQQMGAARPDATGGLGSTVLGVTATQDPAQSQALFQQMAAEKAVGLQPQGGIYQRLKTALAVVAQNPMAG